MILPRPARSRTTAGHDLGDAAPVSVDDSIGKSARTQVQRIRDSITVFVSLTGEGKGGVERALVGDVGPDAQPVRGQGVVANPALQVGCKGRAGGNNRLGRGKPEKVAVV